MHDKLFKKCVEEGVESFKQYASEIGLNQKEFNQCLDPGIMSNEVRKNLFNEQSLEIFELSVSS
jgi:hypothetical protein